MNNAGLSVSKSGHFPLKVVTDFNLSERTQSIPENEIKYADRSPQSKVADEIKSRDLFRRIKAGEWERGFVELVQLIASQQDIDPLLQLILLRRIVETGKQGSRSLDEAWERLWAKLDEVQVDLTANWLWPLDDNGKRSREKSSDLIARVASGDVLNEYARQAAELLRKDAAPLPPLPNWVGWLRPAGSDLWSYDGPGLLPGSGDLFVLEAINTAGGGHEWQRVGVCRPTGVDWESARDGRFVAGRAVYYFPP